MWKRPGRHQTGWTVLAAELISERAAAMAASSAQRLFNRCKSRITRNNFHFYRRETRRLMIIVPVPHPAEFRFQLLNHRLEAGSADSVVDFTGIFP